MRKFFFIIFSLLFMLGACHTDETIKGTSQTKSDNKKTAVKSESDEGNQLEPKPIDTTGNQINLTMSFKKSDHQTIGSFNLVSGEEETTTSENEETSTDVEKEATASEKEETSTNNNEVKLNNGIVITEARISVGMIKIKSTVEESKEEAEVKKAAFENMRSVHEDLFSGLNNLEQEAEVDMSQMARYVEEQVVKARAEAKEALEREYKNAKEARKKEQELDSSIKVAGPFVIDLLSGTSTPPIEDIEIVDGTYKRIEFRLEKYFSESEKEDPLNGNVFYIKGYFTDEEGEKAEFSLISDQTEFLKLVTDKGFKLQEEQESFAVLFDLNKWFNGIDLVDFQDLVFDKKFERSQLEFMNEILADIEEDRKEMQEDLEQTLAEMPSEVPQEDREEFHQDIESAARSWEEVTGEIRAQIAESILVGSDSADLTISNRTSTNPVAMSILNRVKYNLKSNLTMNAAADDGEFWAIDDIYGVVDIDLADETEISFLKMDCVISIDDGKISVYDGEDAVEISDGNITVTGTDGGVVEIIDGTIRVRNGDEEV